MKADKIEMVRDVIMIIYEDPLFITYVIYKCFTLSQLFIFQKSADLNSIKLSKITFNLLNNKSIS